MSTPEARAARDEGIATATAHADRIDPTWRDRAYDALVVYAQTHPTFTIEQLRAHLNGTLEDPPSLRAWGGVAQRAHRAGIVEHYGWTEAEAPEVHCNVIRVWRSKLCDAPVERHRTPKTELLLDSMQEARAIEHFAEYFRRNYPGPRTIIADPDWHAPRIFRAAFYAIHGAMKGTLA